MKTKLIILFSFLIAVTVSGGCNRVTKVAAEDDRCVVIAERAQIRSSVAVVAADLLEVKRGTPLDILDDETVEGEKWYFVRGADANNTEGWIEARNVVTERKLSLSRKLFEEDRETPVQATGQLRAATNIRTSPEAESDDNILLKLRGGTPFEIVGWKRVPKTGESLENEREEKESKAGTGKEIQSRRKKEKSQADAAKYEDKYETWYKVRLHSTVSPAPAGWVYEKQVELTIPHDIIFYRTGREFIAWSRIDGESEAVSAAYSQRRRNPNNELTPGSWIIFERSNKTDASGNEDPDFDRIRILGYDKNNRNHYLIYLSPKVTGFLPFRLSRRSYNRAITVGLKDADGQIKDVAFNTYKDSNGLLRVDLPEELTKRKERR